MRRIGVFVLAAWTAILLLSACRGQPEVEPPLRVVVSIPPLKSLVAGLAPAGSEVKILLPPGRSEHGYEVTPADLVAVRKANILVLVGSGLDCEHKLERHIHDNPTPDRIDVSFATALGMAAPPGQEEEEDHGEHSHAGEEPHLWLDPVLVEQFIPTLRAAVRDAQAKKGVSGPEEQQRLAEAEAALTARVRAVVEHGNSRLAQYRGKAIVTHHDAWRRLAERFNLEVAAVIRPIESTEPTMAAVAAAIDTIKRQGIRSIYVEPQFSRSAADKIAAETGARIAQLDPLGDGDWEKMIRNNIDVIANVMDMDRRAAERDQRGATR